MTEKPFRGKVVNKPDRYRAGKWVHGYYVPYTYEEGNVEHLIIRPFHGINAIYMQRCEVELETVSRNTEIEDIYGDHIFEGDIVQDDYGLYTVAFCEGTFDSGIYRYHGWVAKDQYGGVDHTPLEHRKFRVVGNIWDDSELLQKEEK